MLRRVFTDMIIRCLLLILPILSVVLRQKANKVFSVLGVLAMPSCIVKMTGWLQGQLGLVFFFNKLGLEWITKIFHAA